MASGGKRRNSGKPANQKRGHVGAQGATLEAFYHRRPQNHQQSSSNQNQVEHNVTNTAIMRQENNNDERVEERIFENEFDML